MSNSTHHPIRIAAALITDRRGRLLLVRKAGTRWFMQAGGKIEPGEDALSALRRELHEEIGATFEADEARHLGRFEAPAANETGRTVEAELFYLQLATGATPGSEIEEVIWVAPDAAESLPLAPLTREHVLPFARALCVGGAGGSGRDVAWRATEGKDLPMDRDTLFLLRPGFEDPAYPGEVFYCWHCALMEGVLASFPDLAARLNVRRVAWPRPRGEVIEHVGEKNQSLPILVLADGETSEHQTGVHEGRAFVADKDSILAALSERHGFASPHP